jgi:hypothetical protein
MKTQFFEQCEEVALAVFPDLDLDSVARNNYPMGGAQYSFVIAGIKVTIYLDRGTIGCFLEAVSGSIGNVELHQIFRRYGTTHSDCRGSLSPVGFLTFIRDNLPCLASDFAELGRNQIPERLKNVQFTPPLNVLCKRAEEALKHGEVGTKPAGVRPKMT